MNEHPLRGSSTKHVAIWLCVVFGGLYFVQGIVEPTEGLIAQPIRSLQIQWGRTTAQLASFAAIIAIPWSIKPVFGLLIDFVPLGQLGQRGYLLFSSLILASVFALLFQMQDELQDSSWLIPMLLICTALFLMFWNFNPFSSSVQYSFMKEHLNFDERFIGINSSAFAAGAMIASIAYSAYCRRITFVRLLRISVIAGVLATLAYLAMVNRSTAIVVSVVSGLTYMTGTMIQLDLAARACPPRFAGTVFSSLMAVSNLSIQMSTSVGGQWFGWMSETWPPSASFRFLVVLGALASGACWLIIPRLTKDDHVGTQSLE